MSRHLVNHKLRFLFALTIVAGCQQAAYRVDPPRPVTLAGTVVYANGAPAGDSYVTVTNTDSGIQSEVLVADRLGRFKGRFADGNYALAISAARGFAWVEKLRIPNADTVFRLMHPCLPINGEVRGSFASGRISFILKSQFTGDTFVTPVRKDGSFAACLPPATYLASLTGRSLSLVKEFTLPETTNLIIEGFSDEVVRRSPAKAERINTSLQVLVDDIVTRRPAIIGLGEATHGTAEFVTARAALTFELVRTMDARLLLFEFDAIAGVALDDYVNGADVDLAKAVIDLGFWITNTVEFLDFLRQVRHHNQNSSAKLHIWGVDVQNTDRPSDVLLSAADELSIDGPTLLALKKAAAKHGKAVLDLGTAERAQLESLLLRLSEPKGTTRKDLLISVAARSLITQFGYWGGDMQGELTRRRDQGMAGLASFLSSQFPGSPACLWAHDGHVSKESNTPKMGRYLSALPSWSPLPYYAIGFYLYQGSARAWDYAGKVGVISHPIPVAPHYALEHVLMDAGGHPDVAWVPLRRVSAALASWLKVPRFARLLGAVYKSEQDMMTLQNTLEAFDAVVVIGRGHDSTRASGSR